MRPGDTEKERPMQGRPFIGVQFECCNIYQRVYLNRQGTGYDGQCPRCGRFVKFVIGPGGSSARFFSAK